MQIQKKSSRSRLQVSYDFQNADDDHHDDGDDNGMYLDIEALQQLWTDFDDLMEALRELPSSKKYIKPAQFKEMARKWAQNFQKYTFDEDVTPYIQRRHRSVCVSAESYQSLRCALYG